MVSRGGNTPQIIILNTVHFFKMPNRENIGNDHIIVSKIQVVQY